MGATHLRGKGEILITLGYLLTSVCGAKTSGCTAPLLLPQKPFFVVWNHPSAGCEAHGIPLNLEKWGIVDNKKDEFIGEEISLLYTIGLWPQYRNGVAYNGGIPQLGNLSSHLDKVQSDIKTLIPNSSFAGLSVIDFEEWRPLYKLNYDALKIYQEKSLELAHKKFPELNSTELKEEARHEFNLAGRNYAWKTLQEAVYVRPRGRWGYYGYPRCWGKDCGEETVAVNDEMNWVFNTSHGLYPSLYFHLNEPQPARFSFINKTVHEALRVKARWAPQDADIFPYALNQNGPFSLFTSVDLSYSIRQPADMGSSGVVLWGSSSMMEAKNECLILQNYINTTLGPYSMEVTTFFSDCMQQQCNGHGRCVRKDYEAFYQYHLQESGRTDCVISEERLMTKKNYKKTFEYIDTADHREKSLKFASEKYTGKTDKDKNMWPFANYLDKLKERNMKDSLKITPLSGLEDKPVTPFQALADNPPASRMNDFNDYVCKCFAGWSGPHCEHQDQ